MCCRKTPRNPRTRRVAPGATDGVCFLLVIFSLHKQRKVTRSRQRAKPRPSGKPCRQPSYRIVFEQMRNRSLACSSGSQVLIEFAKPDDPSRKNVGSPQAQARRYNLPDRASRDEVASIRCHCRWTCCRGGLEPALPICTRHSAVSEIILHADRTCGGGRRQLAYQC